ncbi:hypothetical protein ACET3Z_000308 [Daucus carota]
MPWLVLPFKDPVLKKLKRLFGYPDGGSCFDAGPSLVLVGPRKNVIGCGDIIEPGPASIFREYYDGDLFSREEFAKIERGRVGELKLEMLCSPNTFFKSKDGSQVQFSQLAGKRIIFLFEGDYPEYDGICFRGPLYSAYMDSKGTANEFEVIYFPNTKEINDKRFADMPWLISCPVELLPGGSDILSFYGMKSNKQTELCNVFDFMTVKNVFSWTSMIDGYGENGNPSEVCELFSSMRGSHCIKCTLCIPLAAAERWDTVGEIRSCESKRVSKDTGFSGFGADVHSRSCFFFLFF